MYSKLQNDKSKRSRNQRVSSSSCSYYVISGKLSHGRFLFFFQRIENSRSFAVVPRLFLFHVWNMLSLACYVFTLWTLSPSITCSSRPIFYTASFFLPSPCALHSILKHTRPGFKAVVQQTFFIETRTIFISFVSRLLNFSSYFLIRNFKLIAILLFEILALR